jgi:hypothetical protein
VKPTKPRAARPGRYGSVLAQGAEPKSGWIRKRASPREFVAQEDLRQAAEKLGPRIRQLIDELERTRDLAAYRKALTRLAGEAKRGRGRPRIEPGSPAARERAEALLWVGWLVYRVASSRHRDEAVPIRIGSADKLVKKSKQLRARTGRLHPIELPSAHLVEIDGVPDPQWALLSDVDYVHDWLAHLHREGRRLHREGRQQCGALLSVPPALRLRLLRRSFSHKEVRLGYDEFRRIMRKRDRRRRPGRR